MSTDVSVSRQSHFAIRAKAWAPDFYSSRIGEVSVEGSDPVVCSANLTLKSVDLNPDKFLTTTTASPKDSVVLIRHPKVIWHWWQKLP